VRSNDAHQQWAPKSLIAAVGHKLPSKSCCFSILQIGDERLGGAIAISAFEA